MCDECHSAICRNQMRRRQLMQRFVGFCALFFRYLAGHTAAEEDRTETGTTEEEVFETREQAARLFQLV